jgi:uroporphyrinogen decarboxylase
MNSRNRILKAIHHQEPDRIPVDLGGMRSTTILGMAYARLKKHLEITGGDTFIFDPLLQLAYVEEPVRQRFGCDVVILNSDLLKGWRTYALPDGTPAKVVAGFYTESDGQGGEFTLDNQARRTWHRPASSLYFDPVYWPLADATSISDLDAYNWPVLTDEHLLELQVEARRLYQETDYAILGSSGGSFLEAGQWLRGYSNFMLDLAGDRSFAEALLDRVLQNHLRNADLFLDAVGDFIQIFQMDDDLGAQTGPQINPKLYYDIIQPRQKVLWSHIHNRWPSGALFLHSCGGIYELIPGLIDAGLDIINPVQISARGMDLTRLKSEFGNKLCFWGGGCDTQRVLPFGTPEEVYEHTRRNIEILKTGGGFVFSAIHNIQADVSPQNILAMFEAVHDNCWY